MDLTKPPKTVAIPPLRQGLCVFSDGPSTAFSNGGKGWGWKVSVIFHRQLCLQKLYLLRLWSEKCSWSAVTLLTLAVLELPGKNSLPSNLFPQQDYNLKTEARLCCCVYQMLNNLCQEKWIDVVPFPFIIVSDMGGSGISALNSWPAIIAVGGTQPWIQSLKFNATITVNVH